MSESAASAKVLLVYVWRETGAVRNARPSPRPSGRPPGRGEVGKRREAYRWFGGEWRGFRLNPRSDYRRLETRSGDARMIDSLDSRVIVVEER